jgi:HD-like signal output (HDOD) protein
MSVPQSLVVDPQDKARELVAEFQDLVSLPEVYLRLREVMESPDSSMSEVAEVITLDPALTARLLRIANSALYNFPAEIETLSRAVNILGLRQIHDLVLATSVAQAFAGIPNTLMDMQTFWYRSIYRAFIAKQLGDAAQLPDPEGLFVRGLLLDLGHLILYRRYPDACREALGNGEGSLVRLLQAEAELIGCHALALGGELIRVWGLPAAMAATFDHLLAPRAAGAQASTVAVVQLAALLAHGLDTDRPLADILEAGQAAVWELTQLQPAQVQDLVENASGEVLQAMYQIFAPTPA